MKKISKWIIDITEVYPTLEQKSIQKRFGGMVSTIGLAIIIVIYLIIKY